jgi:L-galactose dehydrogenase
MKYSTLGKTGLSVSSLSLGASALGSVFHEIDEDEGIRAVHAALDAGINYIDVAPAYGATRAETVLGRALHGIDRSRYHLSTKVGKQTLPGPAGENIFDYSEEGIRQSLRQSMERLGVNYFDIVHLHDFDYNHKFNADIALTEGVAALRLLKDEGVIGAVGAGIYPMDLWKRCLVEADLDVMLVHNHYCLNDIRTLELLPLAKHKGVGIINASPFSSGLLSDREAPAWQPASPSERALFATASDFCQAQGTTISKLALQFSSQHPDLPTTLFSTSRTSSIERNLRWHEEPCDYELVAEVQRILEPLMNMQWDYDAALDNMKETKDGEN